MCTDSANAAKLIPYYIYVVANQSSEDEQKVRPVKSVEFSQKLCPC